MFSNLNFHWLTIPIYQQWLIHGLINTILLSLFTICISLVIGLVGAWLQGSRHGIVRRLVGIYVQIFRNTPPIVQLFFFFFVISQLLPDVYDPQTGGLRPFLGPFGTATVALSLFAGAFNIEIFRSGVEAVPAPLIEAAESLGYSRLRYYLRIVVPIAFRISLPALNNNLVNLIKTTTEASVIATPELLYYAGQIYADNFATLEVMLFIWLVYIILIGVYLLLMRAVEKKLRIPGYGSR